MYSVMFMSQLLLCRVIKVAMYSVSMDSNDVSYSKKKSRLILSKRSSEKKNRNLIILHLGRITFLLVTFLGMDTSATVLAARGQCKII